MMHKYSMSFLTAVFLAALPVSAWAASFCTQEPGAFRQCNFTLAEDCRKRAVELKALCIANPSDLRYTVGSAPFCLVGGDHMSSCTYTDRQSCEVDSAREGGAECLDNPSNGK